MKMIKKAVAFAAALFLAASAFAFDADDYVASFNDKAAKISAGFDDFAEQLSIAVPQAATQQNVWSKAYIGKLFPSVPPHFGGGFNVGMTHINTSGLKSAVDALGLDDVKLDSKSYFPVFTADLRIGGLFLPFDFDIAVMKTGKLSTDKLPGVDLNVDFLTIGADVRYAVMEGNLILPKVSVGAGYFYNQGSFAADSKYADATVDYKVHTMYLQAQVSKTFFFITPFVGVRGIVSKSDNGWEWAFNESYANNINSAAETAGKTVKTQDKGSYTTDSFDFNAIQPQIFAGFGLSFFVLDVNFSITADLRNIKDDGLWSGAASVRLSL